MSEHFYSPMSMLDSVMLLPVVRIDLVSQTVKNVIRLEPPLMNLDNALMAVFRSVRIGQSIPNQVELFRFAQFHNVIRI